MHVSPSSRRASSCSRTCGSIRARHANDPAFVAPLVDGIDGYVNDAFGASHRADASIVGPPQFVPSAMGRLLQKEVEVLLGLRNKPRHPFVAVLGGAKISDKLGVVEALLEVVDSLVIGGAMCFTFFAAPGQPDRRLAVRARPGRHVQRLLVDAGAKGKTIHLPDDITGTTADGEGTRRSAPGCRTARRASTSARAPLRRSPT